MSNGAEMLRTALCFAVEEGLEICAPIHDAVLRAKSEYMGAVEEEMREDGDADEPPDLMSFEEFCAFVAAHPVEHLDDTFIGYSGADREAKVRGRFADDTVVRRLPHSSLHGTDAYSERSYFGGLIGILHPYSVLRVLGVNAENREADVVWQYGPLVQSGWATEAEFTPGARRTQTFLVATEGSSDAHILKHAFAILRPEIADFFRFIDVSERHPFPGTGNLLKFAEGLAKIDVQNQVVFLLDNDAEGFDAYQRVQNLSLPSNMRAIMLPDLDAFRAFPARGPEGVSGADINRRAAAIECYLDLDLSGYPPPKVVCAARSPRVLRPGWMKPRGDARTPQGRLRGISPRWPRGLRPTARAPRPSQVADRGRDAPWRARSLARAEPRE